MAYDFFPGSLLRFSAATVTSSQTIDNAIPMPNHGRVKAVAVQAFAAIGSGSVVDVRVLVNGVVQTNLTQTINNATGTTVLRIVGNSQLANPGDVITVRFIETGGTTASGQVIAATILIDYAKN